jgi:hypothetical protein
MDLRHCLQWQERPKFSHCRQYICGLGERAGSVE